MIDDPAAYDHYKQDERQYHEQDDSRQYYRQDDQQYYRQDDRQDGYARQDSGSFNGYAGQHNMKYDDEPLVSYMAYKGPTRRVMT